MNKQDIEKLFDEKFFNKAVGSLEIVKLCQHKQFIFDTIIPEVLKSVIPKENNGNYALYDRGWNDCIEGIKENTKELFNINL